MTISITRKEATITFNDDKHKRTFLYSGTHIEANRIMQILKWIGDPIIIEYDQAEEYDKKYEIQQAIIDNGIPP